MLSKILLLTTLALIPLINANPSTPATPLYSRGVPRLFNRQTTNVCDTICGPNDDITKATSYEGDIESSVKDDCDTPCSWCGGLCQNIETATNKEGVVWYTFACHKCAAD